ncbi:hypothetical protein KBA63_02995 [Candidatus Woesebacteria bacterium]|jgi:hypothetical protein|nr:hypothetical protein [Candidatus Woesebacteria bacterium]MBP9687228.1 hypothetical protein [Candidatus Woesebacteria bacterium]
MPERTNSVSPGEKALDQCFAASRVLFQFTGDSDEFGLRDKRGNIRSIRKKDVLYIFVKDRSPYVVFNPHIRFVGLTLQVDDGLINPLTPADADSFHYLLEQAFVEMTVLIVEQLSGVEIVR